MVLVNVIFDELFYGTRGRHGHGFPDHEATHRLALERPPQQKLLIGRGGSVSKEQADKEPPHAADELPSQLVKDPQEDQHQAEACPDL